MGAGSIGCYVGGRLVADGTADVTFVGRASLADTVAEHGLTLREFEHDEHIVPSKIRFETDPTALSACDVVLCCVKSGATAETAAALVPILRPEAIVVSLQNGLRNPEILREHLPNRVVAAVVSFNVMMRDAGVFHYTAGGPLIVGAGSDPRDAPWLDALRSAGIEMQEVEPIAPEQWTKLLVNLNNAVSALSGAPTRALILSRQYRRVIAMLLDEGLDVLDAAGIRPAKFRGVPLRVMSFILKLPTPIVRVVIRAQLRVDPEARASMWQDLQRGRLTEVDFLNGEVVRLAQAHSTDAPLNRRIVELVHDAERVCTGSPQMTAETLLASLRDAASTS